ncbi:hypothetical protein [Devosia soli]|nr:hypothetical protein [Devosia soli]
MAQAPAHEDLARHPGFRCFKSVASIRYPKRWYRTALIDAALDPAVMKMGPLLLPKSRLPQESEFSFWMSVNGVSTLVVLSEGGCDIAALAARVPTKSVTRLALQEEPTARLRREIWSHQRAKVSIELIVLIVQETDNGFKDLTLRDVRLMAGKVCGDAGPSVYAAIVSGYLQVDIRQGWSPSVPVKLGPMAARLLSPVDQERGLGVFNPSAGEPVAVRCTTDAHT